MKLSTRTLVLGITASLLTLSLVASAQWKKPYTEWSEREANKVLNDSPWGRTQAFASPVTLFRDMPNRGPIGEVGRSAPPNAININFRVRFLSAKPIRLAISRLLELNQKGPISPELAKQLETFRTGEFLEYIVVTVSCDSREAGANMREALSLLYRSGTADLKNDTFLEVKGGKRLFLQEYQPPKDDGVGARFIFPRNVDGKPFITPESEEVRFFTELSSTYRLDRRYKVKDMIYEGKLEY
ncbi:MAG TPA: hypothetical protein VNO14_17570 [Blastocatellia bacterium]|nr:hypothetical protein [Blastocatellia bacterium]